MDTRLPPATLADFQRGRLRDAFRASVARGTARPLLLPWLLLQSIVVPVVFLAVAGKCTSLKPLRVPLAVAIAAYNFHTVATTEVPTSSLIFVSAYGTGLAAAWGALWALAILVWADDPWAGERVQRRRRRRQRDGVAGGPSQPRDSSPDVVDEDVARSLRGGMEYYWQGFPADGPLLARLDWALDLVLAWRGAGWSNWYTTPIPRFASPKAPHTGELVDLDSIPLVTRAGYRRHRTRAAFFRARLLTFTVCYLVLDVCCTLMTRDPHFVAGPPPDRMRPWAEQADHFPGGLPPHLHQLLDIPPYLQWLYQQSALLELYRSSLSLAGILAALTAFLTLDQVVRVLVGPFVISETSPSTAAELWQYPSVYGGVSQVCDQGLAGFWGGWWHQTFRVAFVAPTTWLVRRGWLGPQAAKPVGLLVAFGQSALLHAAGSASTLPTHARPDRPPVFFLLSAAGVALEAGLQGLLKKHTPAFRGKRLATQIFNVAFALVWLHCTQWLFLDDICRAGVWLFEPVPFSVVRWLLYGGDTPIFSPAGSSRAGYAAWRWYRDDFFRWHTGAHWWESGLAL